MNSKFMRINEFKIERMIKWDFIQYILNLKESNFFVRLLGVLVET